MGVNTKQVEQSVRDDGLVAIVRGDFSLNDLYAVAEALLEGGIKLLELTLNSKGALAGIERLGTRFSGELVVGAGTVRTAEDARRALAAGARFLVAPNLDLGAVTVAREHDTLLLPGVFTATEAQTAHAAGCRLVKLFPADVLGPGYLRALRAPLADIGFVPTGGIDPETIGAFHAAGAVAFGIGSYLVRKVSFTPQERDALRGRAAALRAALAQARGGA